MSTVGPAKLNPSGSLKVSVVITPGGSWFHSLRVLEEKELIQRLKCTPASGRGVGEGWWRTGGGGQN